MAMDRVRAYASRARAAIRALPILDTTYRVLVGVLGMVFVLVGIVLVPFPFPVSGWVIVIFGLLILATEFSWARSALRWLRERLRQWGHWLKQQPLWVRGLFGLATAAFVFTVSYMALKFYGVPSWVPAEWVPAWLGLS